jgi:hypothetical protein
MKYNKMTQYIKCPMAMKQTNVSLPKPFQNIPKWHFWYKNIPSGNPALYRYLITMSKEELFNRRRIARRDDQRKIEALLKGLLSVRKKSPV